VSGINGQLSPHVVRCLSGQSGRVRTSPPRLSNLGKAGLEKGHLTCIRSHFIFVSVCSQIC
jgi:hypothetical protein